MLSRWSIEESPTKRDPSRRLLYVKGSLSDVHGLIRKLGAVCGRPKKERGNKTFNFSLSLRKLSDDDLLDIESELRLISPHGGVTAEPEEAPAPKAAPATDDGGGLPIEIAVASGNAPAPIEETPIPAAADAPASVSAEIGKPIAGLNLSGGETTVSAVPKPDAEVPADAAPDVLNLGMPGAMGPFAGQGPPIAGRLEESAGASPTTPDPVPIDSAQRAVGGGGPSGLERLAAMPLFGGQTVRDNSLTLDNFIVGAFNRFAHAGGMSIITSPGTLYQPLYVSGSPGSGKTHMLHALADKLQQQSPQEPIWITSGARLARAAAWAISTNRFSEMEEFAKKARVLIVEDIQFMGIADHNRTQLAGLFKIFCDDKKQIILSSAYSPAMVAAIEQALEIRIAGGQSVELKGPSAEKQDAIVKSALERCCLIGEDEEINQFAKAACKDFNSLGLILRRTLILQDLKARTGVPVGLSDLLGALFQPDAGEAQVTAAADLESKTKELPSPAGGSRYLVLLYPQGQEAHAEWTLRQVAAAAQTQAWDWPFSEAIRKPYAIDPAPTVPFVLAEEAYQEGADAVLVLGPQPGAALADNEGDSRYVLQHLLADGEVPLAWVPYQRVHDPKYHLHAFLDLQPEPSFGVAA